MSDSSPEYVSLKKHPSMRSSQKYRSSSKSSSGSRSKGKTLVSQSGVSMKFRSSSSSKSRKNSSSSSKAASLSNNLNKIATIKNDISRLTEERDDLDFRIFSRRLREEVEYTSDKNKIQRQLWDVEEEIPQAVKDIKEAEDEINHLTEKVAKSMFSFLPSSDTDKVGRWSRYLDTRTKRLETLLTKKGKLLGELEDLDKKFKQSKNNNNDKVLSKYMEVSKTIAEKNKLLSEEMKKTNRKSKPMTEAEKNEIVSLLKGSAFSITK